MLDAILRRLTEPALTAVARRFTLNATACAFASFAVGLAALPAIAMQAYFPGLALVLLSRPISGLAAAAARQSGSAVLVGVFDSVFFAGLPFAFVLADPSRALASVFLMFGLAASSASFFAFPQARGWIGNFELVIGVALACVFPDRFALVAYGLGILCFVAAGARIAAWIGRTP
jgi:hypothetical protein